jgi:chemotaxis regulatin CheY-phosphate phosphatase CheZ
MNKETLVDEMSRLEKANDQYLSDQIDKQNFNELAKQIHQVNVDAGWWVDMNRDIYQTL